MSSEVKCIPPSVDLAKIPSEYDGLWVVVNRSNQAILGSGDTSRKALECSRRATDDPTIVIAYVPKEEHVVLISHPK